MDISWNMAVHNQSAKARKFADKWAGPGYEKGDTESFWLELLAAVVSRLMSAPTCASNTAPRPGVR